MDEVKILAEQQDSSLSSYINLVLRANLESLKKTGGDSAKIP